MAHKKPIPVSENKRVGRKQREYWGTGGTEHVFANDDAIHVVEKRDAI